MVGAMVMVVVVAMMMASKAATTAMMVMESSSSSSTTVVTDTVRHAAQCLLEMLATAATGNCSNTAKCSSFLCKHGWRD